MVSVFCMILCLMEYVFLSCWWLIPMISILGGFCIGVVGRRSPQFYFCGFVILDKVHLYYNMCYFLSLRDVSVPIGLGSSVRLTRQCSSRLVLCTVHSGYAIV